MADIATIGLAVDSRPVDKANNALKRFNNTGKATSKTANQMALSFDSVISSLKLLASGYGAIKAVQYIRDATLLNARYETLGVTLESVGRNAGYTSTEMHSVAEAVQSMGITMIESRASVIKLAQAQVDLSSASKLARIAQDAAVIGGINSSEAFGRLINGVQTAQVETLRTIGINVNFQDSYERLAGTLGKTSKELTDIEKSQARVNVVLEAGDRIAGSYEASMSTAGKQLSSLARYQENFQVIIGETFNDALVIAVEGYTDSLKDANEETRKLQEAGQLREWGEGVVETMAFVADSVAGATGLFSLFGDFIAVQIAQAQSSEAVAKQLGLAFKEKFDAYVSGGDKYRQAAAKRIAANNAERKSLLEIRDVLKEAGSEGFDKNRIPELVDKVNKAFFDGDISASKYTQAIDELTGRFNAVASASSSVDVAAEKQEKAVKKLIESLKLESETYGLSEIALKRHQAISAGLVGTNKSLADSYIAIIENKIRDKELAELAAEAYDKEADAREKAAEKTNEAIKSTREWVEQAEFEITLIGLSNEQREKAIKLREVENLGIETGVDLLSKYDEQIASVYDQREAQRKFVDEQKKAADQMKKIWDDTVGQLQKNFSDGFFDIMQGNFDSLGDGFKALLDRMIADALSAQLTQSLFGQQNNQTGLGGFVTSLFGGGGFGGASSSASAGAFDTGGGFFANLPGFASGTNSAPGGFALVGERGPEVVNLPKGSKVTPNDKLGGSTTNIFNFTVQGQTDQRSQQQIADAAYRGVTRANRRNG